MTTLLEHLGVSDIRDVANPSGIPVNDVDFTGDWIGHNATVTPLSIPGPIDGGGLAAELVDTPAANGLHYIERFFNVRAGHTYHFSLTLNIARHRCQDNASKRGVFFAVVGDMFQPGADDEAPGHGLLMATQLDGDVDSEEAPPLWGNSSLNLVPEFLPISGLWGGCAFPARAAADGVASLRIYLNGQNTGNFALSYDSAPDPIVEGMGIMECRVVDVTGSPFIT